MLETRAIAFLALAAPLAGTAAGQAQPRHWSTYLGGNDDDRVSAVTTAANGDVVVAGSTRSTNFPATPGSAQPGSAGQEDVFVARLSADGRQLLSATHLGGSDRESAAFVHVAADGSIWVGGTTQSSDFPTTPDAFATFAGRSDAFVARLDASLTTLLYATTFGGRGGDTGTAFAVDDANALVYVAGIAGSGFVDPVPTTPGAFQRSPRGVDAYLAILDHSGTSGTTLAYGTHLGGSGFELTVDDLAVDGAGVVSLAGTTPSTDFPVTPQAFQSVKGAGGSADGFVARLDPSQSGSAGLTYGSYLGGSGAEHHLRLLADPAGILHLVAVTSSADLPTTPNAIQSSAGAPSDIHYAQFDPAAGGAAALRYGSWILTGNRSEGLASGERGLGIALGPAGLAILVSTTSSAGLPLTPATFQTNPGGSGGHAVVVDLGGASPSISYATHYRGCQTGCRPLAVAFHPSGDLLLAGRGSAVPVTAGTVQPRRASSEDGFVGRLQPGPWRSFRTLGASCAASSGTPALVGTGPARLCQNLRVDATGLTPGNVGVMFLGPHTTWRGSPLPIPLAPAGGGTCAIHVGLEVVVGLSTGSGTATFRTSVPNLGPFLVGQEVSLQYAFLDPAANALGVVTTNGVAAEVRW